MNWLCRSAMTWGSSKDSISLLSDLDANTIGQNTLEYIGRWPSSSQKRVQLGGCPVYSDYQHLYCHYLEVVTHILVSVLCYIFHIFSITYPAYYNIIPYRQIMPYGIKTTHMLQITIVRSIYFGSHFFYRFWKLCLSVFRICENMLQF